jgi:hypothetical protein
VADAPGVLLRVLERLTRIGGSDVEHVHQGTGPLDVGEEVVSEPGAVAGTLDETGNVGDHELAIVGLQRAEHRRERGKRIVGDLRRGAGEPGDQR